MCLFEFLVLGHVPVAVYCVVLPSLLILCCHTFYIASALPMYKYVCVYIISQCITIITCIIFQGAVENWCLDLLPTPEVLLSLQQEERNVFLYIYKLTFAHLVKA